MLCCCINFFCTSADVTIDGDTRDSKLLMFKRSKKYLDFQKDFLLIAFNHNLDGVQVRQRFCVALLEK